MKYIRVHIDRGDLFIEQGGGVWEEPDDANINSGGVHLTERTLRKQKITNSSK
jgi:hypothetical protein